MLYLKTSTPYFVRNAIEVFLPESCRKLSNPTDELTDARTITTPVSPSVILESTYHCNIDISLNNIQLLEWVLSEQNAFDMAFIF